jgi:D-3-phosphoglycerate dehydrogenase / 2-oxoglutarate reductase
VLEKEREVLEGGNLMAEQRIVMRVDQAGDRVNMPEEKEELDKVGAKLMGVNCITEGDIIETAKKAKVIITVGARMTRQVMENLPDLLAVVRYGVDTVDVEAATDNHVLIINVPDFCFEEVANHAMALLLVCAKKIVYFNALLKQGRWREAKAAQAPMGCIHGETLGLVGCGNIGRTVAKKARCFNLRLLGYDPYVDKALAGEAGITLVDLKQLLRESDYVSLHTLLNQETFHMIGEKELNQMKESAFLINTARGPVVDEKALIKALQNKKIAGAGLDVFEIEPLDPANPLLKMENVVVLPHSASYSDISFKGLRTSVGQEAARVISGYWPRNVVNKTVKPKIELIKER